MWRRLHAVTEERRESLTSSLYAVSELTNTKLPFYFIRFSSGLLILAIYNYILLWSWNRSSPDIGPSLALPILFSWSYLCFIFYGMRYMENREPVKSRIFEWNCVYNMWQGGVSVFLFFGWISEARRLEFSFWGNSTSISSPLLKFLIWFQFQAHLVELWDTLFLIFRKRHLALSFLHFFLRILNLWMWFFACHFFNGGDCYFMGAVNAFVNGSVYVYYLLTLCGLPLPNWHIKTLVIQIVMSQFVILGIHAVFMLFYGNTSHWVALIIIFVMCLSFVLYADFYYETTHHETGKESSGERTVVPNGSANGNEGMGANGKLVFSFDSSGWLFLYHWGVAAWLEDHFGVRESDDSMPISMSGSSGGALVAVGIASRIRIRDMVEFIIKSAKDIPFRRKPWIASKFVETTIDKFFTQECFERINNNVRILMTKVRSKPPFFAAEAATKFNSLAHAKLLLRASSHIPVFFGVLPFYVKEQKGYYYDGLMWPSMVAPWRYWNKESDHIVKVSVYAAATTAQIRPTTWMPPLWCIFPPSPNILWGLFWAGYKDAEQFYKVSPRRGGGFGCGVRSTPNCLTWKKLQEMPCKPDHKVDPKADAYIEEFEKAAENFWSCLMFIMLTCFVVWLAFVVSQ